MGVMTDEPTPARAGPAVNGCFLDRLLLIAAARGQAPAARDHLARAHGVDGDANPLGVVLAVAEALGLAAEYRCLAWEALPGVHDSLPALLIFRDGATAILDGMEPARPGDGANGAGSPDKVLLRDEGVAGGAPGSPDARPPLALGRDDLALFWAGDVIVPGSRGASASTASVEDHEHAVD